VRERRLGWQVHESVFDGNGHRMELHDFRHGWLIVSDTVNSLSDQFLDEVSLTLRLQSRCSLAETDWRDFIPHTSNRDRPCIDAARRP
jgi:hypothetical protein